MSQNNDAPNHDDNDPELRELRKMALLFIDPNNNMPESQYPELVRWLLRLTNTTDIITAPDNDRILDECESHLGRWFGTWRRKYLFPIDKEERTRLDIFHKVFTLALGPNPIHVPLPPQKPRIMDLGTGTGIWAMNIIEEGWAPDAEITMVDLNRIQPKYIPANTSALQFDIEHPDWSGLMFECDLIHMRMLLGSIKTCVWQQTYTNIFGHLTPGGWFSQVEIDWTPRWDSPEETQPDSHVARWAYLFHATMDRYGRSARVDPGNMKRSLEQVGFTEFSHKEVKAYVNPWKPELSELGSWFNLALIHSVMHLSWKPFFEKLRYDLDLMKEMVKSVNYETSWLSNHPWCTIHVFAARRPGGSSPGAEALTGPFAKDFKSPPQ